LCIKTGGDLFCSYHQDLTTSEAIYHFYPRLDNRVQTALDTEKKNSGRTSKDAMSNDRASYFAPENWKETDMAFMDAHGERLKGEYEAEQAKASMFGNGGADEKGSEQDDEDEEDDSGSNDDDANGRDKKKGKKHKKHKPEKSAEEEDSDDEDEVLPSWEQNETYRKLAFENGLIRPLLILVSMTQMDRLRLCAMLGIRLAAECILGDAYGEAWAILTKKDCGLQERLTEWVGSIFYRCSK
jgi:hypothetical protein